MSEAFTKMSEDTSIYAEKSELMSYINNAIAEIVADKELSKVSSISRSIPQKVAKILY